MQNKQLERELRSIVQNLKGNQILKVIETMEKEGRLTFCKEWTSKDIGYLGSGLNCTCCTLKQGEVVTTGFGRNQQEALVNAAKNYVQTLIATNTQIQPLTQALKHRSQAINQHANPVRPSEKDCTLALQPSLSDLSMIDSKEAGCTCIYYEVHQHHMAEIKNMQTRMKLLVKENEMLKQLLLKDNKNKKNQTFKGRQVQINQENEMKLGNLCQAEGEK